MGNDIAFHVVVIDIVEVTMYNGIMRTFGNVRHVFHFRNNLISLGTSEDNGLTYSSRGGNMKICKGSLVVNQGVKFFNNLYKLFGDIVAGGAFLFAPAIADEHSTHL